MKILIIKPSSLGDVIHGLQVATEIFEQTHADIDWVIKSSLREIVEISNIIRRIFIFERHGGWSRFRQLIRSIRQEHYDYVLDMQGLARSGLLTFSARCPRSNKIGRRDARECSWLSYGRYAPFPSQTPPHAIDILRGFSQIFSPKLPQDLPHFALTPRVTPAIADILSDLSRPIISLFPESQRPEKEWPYFEPLAQQILETCPSATVILAGQRPEPVTCSASSRLIDIRGRTTLSDIIHVVQRSSLVVANDSAPMHIAAAAHVPVIALFGPTSPLKYGPYPLNDPRNTVLTSPTGSLTDLPVNTVLEAVLQHHPANSRK